MVSHSNYPPSGNQYYRRTKKKEKQPRKMHHNQARVQIYPQRKPTNPQ